MEDILVTIQHNYRFLKHHVVSFILTLLSFDFNKSLFVTFYPLGIMIDIIYYYNSSTCCK